jgi:hypothetical protein
MNRRGWQGATLPCAGPAYDEPTVWVPSPDLTSFVVRLVAELAAQRQANEWQAERIAGQADRIAELERENQRVMAERDAARMVLDAVLQVRSAAQRPVAVPQMAPVPGRAPGSSSACSWSPGRREASLWAWLLAAILLAAFVVGWWPGW